MNMNRAKKICSFIVLFCLFFSLVSVSFAEEVDEINDVDVEEIEKIINDIMGDTPSDEFDEPEAVPPESDEIGLTEYNPLPEIVSSDDLINPYKEDEITYEDDQEEPAEEPEPEKGVEPEEPVTVDNPFVDVKESDYFFAPVMWAVANDITKGKYYNSFAPEITCNRAEAVTFLWRANGKPDPTSYKHGFKDIDKDAYYYRAVLWAAENGITGGTSDTTFSPEEKCTRGQIVTFLYRLMNSADVEYSFTDKFIDVADDVYYAQPVSWAVDNGITEGMGENTFSPDDYCTRAQIVTFLYRACSPV